MSKISELSDGGSLVSSDYLIAVRSGGNVKVRMDQINVDQVDLGDNEFIRLGNSQDLTMVHTSTQSIINQAGIGDLLLQKAGATKLTINATGIDVTGSVTTTGDLGIGGAPLANNQLLLTDAGTYSQFHMQNSTSGSGASDGFRILMDGVNTTITNHETGYMAFETQDTQRMRIDASGLVGIGSSTMSSYNTNFNDLVIDGGTNTGVTIVSDTAGDGTLAFADGTTGNEAYRGYIQYTHAGDDLKFGAGGAEAMRISGAEVYVGHTGATAPWAMTGSAFGINLMGSGGFIGAARSGAEPLLLNRTSSDGAIINLRKDGATVGSIGNIEDLLYIAADDTTDCGIRFDGDNQEISPCTATGAYSDGNIDLGDGSARFKDLHLSGVSYNGDGSAAAPSISFGADTNTGFYRVGSDQIGFVTAGTIKAKLDASGNLLVGTTTTAAGNEGMVYFNGSSLRVTRDSDEPLNLDRLTSDGDIAVFKKDGASVGSIGTINGSLYISSTYSTDSGLRFSASIVHPCTTTGAPRDNAIDLGYSAGRFVDIYATNGTIQTSDRNEKQDIEALSDAEQRVAVAAKGLLRKFRWKSSVAEKGDEARTHFGIIAQDLQAAFAAEGLDAGDYAMFINSTWTDEETGEERSRMGVRYSELLAFIIAAI